MADPIILFSEPASKCIMDGIKWSDGPGGDFTASIKRIKKANPFKIKVETQNFPEDFDRVASLAMEVFFAGNCGALIQDRKAEFWDEVLKTTAIYWLNNPTLTRPFPTAKFPAPDMDCAVRIQDLVIVLQNLWEDAQS